MNKVTDSHAVLASLVDECFLEESERSSERSESDTASFSMEALKALGNNTLHKTGYKDDFVKVLLHLC